MKKILSLSLATLMMFALAACGGTAESEAAPAASEAAGSMAASEAADSAAPAADGEPLQVALIMGGPINDQGWNAEAYRGLMEIEEQLGAEVQFSENVDASDYEEVFRGYADMGYDLIVGHGFQFGESAMAVAEDYPETFFAITSTDISQAPNVASLMNRNDQQGFLAGALAAMETETGIVGCVGGMEIPSITAYVEGFIQGAAYIDPDVQVLANYTGDFKDVAAAKQMAEAMIAEGADIITHDADASGVGVFEAVNAAAENVRIIGAIDDQYELSPERTITSAMSQLGGAIVLAAELVQDGTIEATSYAFGVNEGVVYLADFRDYPISEENLAELEAIQEQLGSGEITIEGVEY